MAEIKILRVQDLGDDFKRLGQPRAGSVEKVMAVGGVTSLLVNRRKLVPAVEFLQCL